MADAFDRLTIDGDALLSTPYHRTAGQAREVARGTGRHGSCGMGVGETVSYALRHPDVAPRVADTRSPAVLRRKLGILRDWARAETAALGPWDVDDDVAPDPLHGPPGMLAATPVTMPDLGACMDAYLGFGERVRIVDGAFELTRLLATGPCVFEGAQGVLLDEWQGFHPYTTWSTTTFANAEELLARSGTTGDATRLGVVRTYTTRHGAGPLVTEDAVLRRVLPDPHNEFGPWQGSFRAGHFDAVAHRYALDVAGGADALAVTHADVPARCPELRFCDAYAMPGGTDAERLPVGERGDLDYQAALTVAVSAASPYLEAVPGQEWTERVAGALGVPVAVVSSGPTSADKRAAVDLRAEPVL